MATRSVGESDMAKDSTERTGLDPQTSVGCLGLAVAVIGLLLAPAVATAQAIGGTVTDSTGGALPGVTIEARSPALIEQVRTAVSDDSGQYLIVALVPGNYALTFTLSG